MTILNETQHVPRLIGDGSHERGLTSPSSNHDNRTEQIKFCGRDMTQVPEHIWRCDSLRVLDFSNNCLGRVIPADSEELKRCFGELKRLKGLNLSCNELKSWPSFLDALVELEVLSLSGNELEDVPENIPSKLRRLHADFNHIRVLPVTRWNVMAASLTTLTMSNNHLEEIPASLWTIPSLKRLDVRKNRISDAKFPSGNVTSQLEYLNLAHNCLKGRLELSRLSDLAVLDVAYNNIEQLDIELLGKLESINCSNNQLKTIKLHGAVLRVLVAECNDLESITCKNPPLLLEKLVLSQNCLKEIPQWVLLSKKLIYLCIDHNQITNVPDRLFDSAVNQLAVMNLNHNSIERLPSCNSQCSVRELYLQCNNIKELPDNFFSNFLHLQMVNLSYNQLQHFPSVCKCTNLRHVQLSGNRLSDVSCLESLFRHPTLSVLHLAHNDIKNIPDNFFNNCPSLAELSLAGNQLQHLSSHITKAKHIRKLFLHSNALKLLPELTQMTELKVLDLANNDFSGLKLEMLIPTNLTYLDLSANPHLLIDPTEFQTLCTQRSVAVVDINSSGVNHKPTQKDTLPPDLEEMKLPWSFGCTETERGRTRLFVELQKKNLAGQYEAILAFIEADDNELAQQLRRALPGFIRTERECEETPQNYLRNVLLSSVRFLRAKGQSHDLGITLCQLSTLSHGGQISLRLATFGKPSSCILGRAGNAIILAQRDGCRLVNVDEWMDVMAASDVFSKNRFESGPVTCSLRGPWAAIPDPEIKELILNVQDKYVVFGDSNFSKTVSAEEVYKIVHSSKHPVAAAKALSEKYASVSNGRRECVAIVSLKSDSLQRPEQEDVEKYRCWEFMLEQNHKLLFTKELETIHKTILNSPQKIGSPDPSSWYSSAFSKYRCPLPSHRGRYYCYGNKSE